MQELFTFIKQKFDLMPKWVQVLTYLSLLIVFIYLITLPRYLDMKLVSNDFGDQFGVGKALVEVETSGRVISILTGSKGRFSVPISTRLPFSKIVMVLYPDSKKMAHKEIKVSISNSYLERSKIIYTKKDNNYRIKPDGFFGTFFDTISNLVTAYADNGEYAQNRQFDEIEDEVLQAVQVITRISPNNIPLDVHLDDLGIGNYELSYINERINRRFEIDILDDLWRSARTVGDIIDISREKYNK